MAEVSIDLIFDARRPDQTTAGRIGVANLRAALASGGSFWSNAVQQDVQNLVTAVSLRDDRMDRIERRVGRADAH